MAPKKETPDAPKTKRVMTPDQLEKLAQARVKAGAVRQALKEDREDTKLKLLQDKMDTIKAKKTMKPPTKEEVIPEEPDNVEPTSVPVPDEESAPDKEDKIAKVEPVVEPVVEPKTQAGPPVEKLKKKKKKPIVIVQNSESDSDSDDSNVIYIKKSSRKKKPENFPQPVPPPQPPPPAPKVQYNRPPSNPFFAWNSGLAQRNFM